MRRALLLIPTVLAVIVASIFTPLTALAATTWNLGDVFVGVEGGKYNVYDNSGVFKQTISNPAGGYTTGCAFDKAGNFYGTYLSANQVIKFDGSDPHSSSFFGSGFSIPESLVFDKHGNVYVGNTGGGIREYAPNGTFIKTVIPTTRVDWFDLAADQDTILYTQEGSDIKRVSAGTGLSLSNFTTGTANQAFALRILPGGSVLLADRNNVKRYDSAGTVVQTYTVGNEGTWFALNLDPNGSSFWSGNYGSSNFYRLNIASGAVEIGPINTGTTAFTLFGICLKGELTAAIGQITLTPATAQNAAGTTHTVTAKVTTNASGSAGVPVSFSVISGPNTGATGTCSVDAACHTDANGQVSFTYTSNGTPGTDVIQACFTDQGQTQQCATATKTWILVEQPIAATGATISATEGTAFTGTVATITDPDPNATANEYTAFIDWGDSTPATSGTVTGSMGGPFTVIGSHTYAEEGTYTVTVAITDVDTSSNGAIATSGAKVADATLSALCAMSPFIPQSYTGPTATFNDASSTGNLSDFSATISWGDGSSSPADGQAVTIAGGPGNAPYAVGGSHTYSSTGTFTVTTSITDVGTSTASASCTEVVFAFAPEGGSFVIGDHNSGTAVTFWGAKWAKENSLSGGAAPLSFKGFAENPNTPSCGTGWSADPGNSTPPPDGPLPAFMAVIVSSSADKSGSTISGNTVHIVIVKTNPGYTSNPGHAGTGTVVGQVC